MYKLITFAHIFIFLTGTSIHHSHADGKINLPEGWRAPVKSDYHKNSLALFGNGMPTHIKADFNGDGLDDQAWILIKKATKIMDYSSFWQKMKTILM